MKYGIVKNCIMNWETEEHSFTFDTGGSKITALDSLGDLIGSLNDLYQYIREDTSYNPDEDIPMYIKVRGGFNHTVIDGKLYEKPEPKEHITKDDIISEILGV